MVTGANIVEQKGKGGADTAAPRWVCSAVCIGCGRKDGRDLAVVCYYFGLCLRGIGVFILNQAMH